MVFSISLASSVDNVGRNDGGSTWEQLLHDDDDDDEDDDDGEIYLISTFRPARPVEELLLSLFAVI